MNITKLSILKNCVSLNVPVTFAARSSGARGTAIWTAKGSAEFGADAAADVGVFRVPGAYGTTDVYMAAAASAFVLQQTSGALPRAQSDYAFTCDSYLTLNHYTVES